MIYLKPTNFCNIGCDHCYIPIEMRDRKHLMSDEVLVHAAQTFGEMKKFYGQENVSILWNGGEPLSVSRSWYENASEILDRHLGPHTQSMQTSLIPLRREFLPYIHTRMCDSIRVGFNFNSRKINGSWKSYESLFMEKVTLVREEGIDIDLAITVSQQEIGHQDAIVQWFSLNGFHKFRSERYTEIAVNDPNYVGNREISDWNIGLFDVLMTRIRDGKQPIAEYNITAGIKVVLSGERSHRWGPTCTSDFFVVEPNGDVFNCTDKVGKERPMGHVSMGWEGLLTSPERLRMIQEHSIDGMESYCLECEYFEVCRGGCPILPRSRSTDQSDCAGNKHFLEYIRNVADTQEGMDLIQVYLKHAGQEETAVTVS